MSFMNLGNARRGLAEPEIRIIIAVLSEFIFLLLHEWIRTVFQNTLSESTWRYVFATSLCK